MGDVQAAKVLLQDLKATLDLLHIDYSQTRPGLHSVQTFYCCQRGDRTITATSYIKNRIMQAVKVLLKDLHGPLDLPCYIQQMITGRLSSLC